MDPELRDILRSTAADPVGDSHTHVSLFGPLARWTVRSQNQTDFWGRYCDLVDVKTNGRNGTEAEPYAALSLAERSLDVMPVIADFTFRFHSDVNDEGWEPYSDEFLEHLVYTYQCVLYEYFRVSETMLELVAVILESATHWFEVDRESGSRYLHMNLRIQFPYARVDTGIQSRFIRTQVIQMLRNNNVMSRLPRQPVGDWNDIISMTSVTEPIVMYGSTSVLDRPKLQLLHIWAVISNTMIEEGTLPEAIPLSEAYEYENHSHVHQGLVSPTIFPNHPLEYWLPMFLSVHYWPSILLPKENVTDNGRFTAQLRTLNLQTKNEQRPFGVGSHQNDDIDDTDAELAERMIVMLSNDRFLKETFWMDIGKAFYHANEGAENGLLSWIRHTQRATAGMNPIPEYMRVAESVAETCRNLYNTLSNSHITVKTLAWYAREDSPERYATWHQDWCTTSMEQALSCYHTDVAVALRRVYWLDFTYCDGRWFWFKNHRHSEINQGIELRKAISSDFRKRFERYRAVLSRQVHESTDESFKGNAEITIKKLGILIGKLKTVSFKSSIVTEVSEHFNDPKFVSLLDSSPELTGIINGVLEVSGHCVVFRTAKPEDYISMCTNNPYHSNYTWQHPLVQECMKWFGQVFTDKALLHHFLKFAASCLKGRNSDKIFPIFTGEGDNSKSMIVKLFESTFHSYCIKFDISNVTGKAAGASGPTPQLARAKATRIAFMDEPEDDVPMNKGIIKKWVGGDSFFTRFLHDNGGDVQVTFKLVLTCNKVPVIPNADRAIKNRTRLFPYLSTWVDDASDDEAQQYAQKRFKKNPFFERRIPVLAPAFLWIMTQYYPHYAVEGLEDPPIIEETTNAYWKDNDVYAAFCADTIAEVYTETGERDTGARVTLSDIYAEFKIWFRDSFPGTKVPERPIVKNELSSRWGRMQGNAWYGIRIISNEIGTTEMTAALGGKAKPAQAKPVVAKPVVAKPTTPTTLKVTTPETLKVVVPNTLKVTTPETLKVQKPTTPTVVVATPNRMKGAQAPIPLTPTQKFLQNPPGTVAL